MAAGLHRQKAGFARLIQPFCLIDDIFIAPLKAMVPAAQLLFDKFRQLVACHRVGDDGTARGLLRRDGRRQCDQPVAPQLGAVGLHRTRPVHIGIKDQSQIAAARQYRPADALHRFLILGVRHVVGEAPVRLQVDACGNIGAQRRQYPCGIKAARPVSGIHRYFQPGQRPVAVLHLRNDALPQHGGIGGQNIKRREPPVQPCRRRAFGCPPQDLLDIGGLQPALIGEKL